MREDQEPYHLDFRAPKEEAIKRVPLGRALAKAPNFRRSVPPILRPGSPSHFPHCNKNNVGLKLAAA